MSLTTPLRAAVDVQRAALEGSQRALDLAAGGQASAVDAAAAMVTDQERAQRTALELSRTATTGSLAALAAANPALSAPADVTRSLLDAGYETAGAVQTSALADLQADFDAAGTATTTRDHLDALARETAALRRTQDAARDRLSDDVGQLSELVNTRFDTVETELSERIAENRRAIDSRLDETVAEVDARIEGTEDHVDARVGQVEGEVESRLSQSQEQIELQIETVQDDVDARIEDVSEQLTSQLAALEQHVAQLRQQVEAIDDAVGTEAAQSEAE